MASSYDMRIFSFKDLGSGGMGDDIAMETDERTDRQSCYYLFSSFIREVRERNFLNIFEIFQVVIQMQQYKDDLLASCLHLILVLPKEMVVSDFKELIPAVKVGLFTQSPSFSLTH